jgi:hypothetical protein
MFGKYSPFNPCSPGFPPAGIKKREEIRGLIFVARFFMLKVYDFPA